jgi:hypothetical protein
MAGETKERAPKPALDEAGVQSIVRLARLAGADKLDELASTLRKADAEAVKQLEAKIAAVRVKNLDSYHVAGPGSLSFGGQTLAPGETLQLTILEAEELGAIVAPGTKAERVVSRDKRAAGAYCIGGPGSIWQDGRLHEPGAVVQLSAEEARSYSGDLTIAK